MRVRLMSSHTQLKPTPEVIQKHNMYAFTEDDDEAAAMLENIKQQKIKHHFETLCDSNKVDHGFPYRHTTYLVFEEITGAILFKMLYPKYGAKMEYGETNGIDDSAQ